MHAYVRSSDRGVVARPVRNKVQLFRHRHIERLVVMRHDFLEAAVHECLQGGQDRRLADETKAGADRIAALNWRFAQCLKPFSAGARVRRRCLRGTFHRKATNAPRAVRSELHEANRTGSARTIKVHLQFTIISCRISQRKPNI
jgi:hypothetical protein